MTRSRAGWSLIVGGVAGLAFLALWFVMGSRSTQATDDQAMLGMQLPLGLKPLVEKGLKGVALVAAPGAILGAVLVGLRRRRPWLAGAALLSSVGTFALVQGAKAVIPRPQLGIGLPDNTLPSGHTAIALGAAMAAVVVSSRKTRRRVRIAASGAVVLVGCALIGVTYHRPSDVLASLCCGAIVVGLVGVVWTGLERARKGPLDKRGVALLGTPRWKDVGHNCLAGLAAVLVMLLAGWRPGAGARLGAMWAWGSVVLLVVVTATLLSTVRPSRTTSPFMGSGRRRVVGRRI